MLISTSCLPSQPLKAHSTLATMHRRSRRAVYLTEKSDIKAVGDLQPRTSLQLTILKTLPLQELKLNRLELMGFPYCWASKLCRRNWRKMRGDRSECQFHGGTRNSLLYCSYLTSRAASSSKGEDCVSNLRSWLVGRVTEKKRLMKGKEVEITSKTNALPQA
ncbi:hypothetical protein RRG08_007348 [Elysia crispata]|uniref:Uncharacterized protein n=1 Tax=Elysia crispata TaxID=231223 RepID=A0AAE1E2R0_9GAST|nr:hypothetical protein RRG08_007348 [Elysia crispata]